MAWYDAQVVRSASVQGGAAVLVGTRMPVGSVVAVYRLYGGDRAQVRAAYPHLTDTQISAALAYYEHHHDEIDSDEELNARAFEALARAS